MIKNILQSELGTKKFSPRLSPSSQFGEKTVHVEASKEALPILQESEANHFDGIATNDESWFRYLCPCSKMFARSRAKVIPRTRYTIAAKQTVITVFFIVWTPTVLGVLPRGSIFNRLDFSGFEKGKPEFLSPNAPVGFLSAYRKFFVPQWIKTGVEIREP
jgi:hypothetical protein